MKKNTAYVVTVKNKPIKVCLTDASLDRAMRTLASTPDGYRATVVVLPLVGQATTPVARRR